MKATKSQLKLITENIRRQMEYLKGEQVRLDVALALTRLCKIADEVDAVIERAFADEPAESEAPQ